MTVAVSLLASVITFVFAGAVLLQYYRRPRPHRLIWALALICYGVATLAQFAAEAGGWTMLAFRVWYLSGGLLTAAYLGQGTALLLLPRRLARATLILLLLATVAGTVRLLTMPLQLSTILPPAGRISPRATALPADVRAMAALLNIYGTLLLVGGAIWSALVYVDRMLDRRRRAGYRLASNLLIAGGALIIATAGSFEAFGRGEYLYLGEILGIAVIFLGFLRSNESMAFWLPRRRSRADLRPPAGTPPPPLPVRSLRRIGDRTTSGRR